MIVDLTSAYAAESLKALQALLWVMDPELGINIVDMGLVYGLDFSEHTELTVKMTLSSPYCPMGESITSATERTLSAIFPNRIIKIDLIWQPPWNPEMMTEEGRNQLNK